MEGENNKCYVKYVFWNALKTIKLLMSQFLVILKTFIEYSKATQRKTGHSKSTIRSLQGHSNGPLALGHFIRSHTEDTGVP